MTTIDSPANPRVKALARLSTRRHREAEGRFVVEGRREVERALAAGVDVETVLFAPDLAHGDAPDHPEVLVLSEAAFGKISRRSNPDGVAAVARMFPTDLDRAAGHDLVLVAEGMEKPGNIGAMIRSADAAGAAVVLASPVADVFNPNVIRASQGSVFSVPVGVAPADEVRSRLEGRMQLLVAAPGAERPYWDQDLRPPTAVVIGAEHEGVSAEWDRAPRVSIPMGGSADSLNASVAAALVLFEARRQRTIPA